MSDYGTPPPSYGGMPPAQPPMSEPPSNNLVWAILTTLFCCLPLGVVSIVFAAQVNGKWQAGDYAGAQEASRKAKQWAIWSAVLGAIGIVLAVVLSVAGVLAAPTTTTGY
ncbi:MAG: CD225/dispanin family protein [Actinomycetes bacterium]